MFAHYSTVPSDAVSSRDDASPSGHSVRQRSEAQQAEAEYYEHDAAYTEWLKWYREVDYPRYRHPDVTVDCIILTVDASALKNPSTAESCLKALVVDRWTPPFKGSLALPGTFMRANDNDERAVIARMLRNRFDFDAQEVEGRYGLPHIRQLRTFTGVDRDPRGQVVSIANIVYLQHGMETIPEADGVHWVPLLELAQSELAFDHHEIVIEAVNRIRSQFAWEPYVFWALPQPFTVTDAVKLRASLFGEAYKAVNRKNFKRKYQAHWVQDHVEINPVTSMPLDFYRYEGTSEIQ